jgi:photosystem II PsbU protein
LQLLSSNFSRCRLFCVPLPNHYCALPSLLKLHYSSAAAFAPNAQNVAQTALNAESDRRAFLGAAAAITAAVIPAAANAKVDYENIAYLGGGSVIDLNNANVRAYLRLPGMYPSAAGKIVSHGPYKSVADVYSIPGLSSAEKEVIKKYESRFTAKEPTPEYVIDRINNGLYR